MLLTGMFLFSGCGDDNEENKSSGEQPQSSNKGCISGKITKFYSGNQADAQVHLLDSDKNKIGSPSKITGFNFLNLDEGIYYIMVTKLEFDTIRPEPIRVLANGNGKDNCQQIDWQLSKIPSSLCVIEINNSIKLTPLDTLDFGVSQSLQRFKIFNNTENVVSWNIRWSDIKKSCDWISEITYGELSINDSSWNPENGIISGTLSKEETSDPVSIFIDRSKWSNDKNPALVPINGGGGWDLYITATNK